MKGCELCPGTARMYCESDQASLCFECDAKVHGANFLVARHSRSLLCRSCQVPTPWKASGPRLGPTVSVCDRCVAGRSSASKKAEEVDKGEGVGESGEREREGVGESGERERIEEDFEDNDQDVDREYDDDDDEVEEDEDEDDESDDEEEEEEGEEQVVPWTAEPPPMASSSSSEEESAGRVGGRMLKRLRDTNVDLSCSQYQLPCSSPSSPSYFPNRTGAEDEATSESFRPLKYLKKADPVCHGSRQMLASPVSFGSSRPPI